MPFHRPISADVSAIATPETSLWDNKEVSMGHAVTERSKMTVGHAFSLVVSAPIAAFVRLDAGGVFSLAHRVHGPVNFTSTNAHAVRIGTTADGEHRYTILVYPAMP
jgi:hypothetical protein